MLTSRAIALLAGLLWALPVKAAPITSRIAAQPAGAVTLVPAVTMPNVVLPSLRPPLAPGQHLPPPIPLVGDAPSALREAAALRMAMAHDVPGLLRLSPGRPQQIEARARAMLAATHTILDAPQLVVVVDRAPSVQTLALMLAQPGAPWVLIGAVHVSTGQAGRKDYYITPVGVFAHTAAILDFRALGTYNEHHVRGLGLAGMRVWDFGWQWALKGWHTDGEGGDIRLQMHATDPTLLERRLGRPASEGCVRVSSAMNRFMDGHGVLDADIERAAVDDARYRALLRPDRTPTPIAGRLMIVIDDRDPVSEPPTQASRPANWPPPPDLSAPALTGTTGAGTL